jgi:isopentenyl-diphosphate Delta-isomerase
MSSHIERRKSEHIAIAQNPAMQMHLDNGLSPIRFEPMALPELHLDQIDTSVSYLGKPLAFPLQIASMSGGTKHSQQLNEAFAAVAETRNIALGLGSMRVAFQEQAKIDAFNLRHIAPRALILANMGATQLNEKNGLTLAQQCIDLAEADGIIIHLNPLQEAIQPSGDRDWRGIADKIAMLVKAIEKPVVIKEVGHGIGPTTIKQLIDIGVRHIDVAGAGGTSWAAIETQRAMNTQQHNVGHVFHNFGMTLTEVLRALHQEPVIKDSISIVASGGIRSGYDIAKALRLGATLTAAATPFLHAAIEGYDALLGLVDTWQEQLKITCLVTASQDIHALKHAKLI